MKRAIIFILVSLLVVFVLSHYSNNILETDPAEYGNWNSQTDSILDESFKSSLPGVELAKKYCKDYYYNSNQSVLGDVNFVVYAKFEISDRNEYEPIINSLNSENIVTDPENDETYYFIQGDSINISRYIDDETEDGMFYDFEIVEVNDQDRTVSYLSAHVWDYYTDDLLIDYFKDVIDNI